MFKQKIEEDLKKVVKDLGYGVDDIVCDIPKNKAFGDYTSNIPLQLANQKSENNKQSPQMIAKEILDKFGQPDYLEKVEIAGSGFINFYLKSEALLGNLRQVCDYSNLVNPEINLEGEKKKIVIEHTSPNTNKPLHVGHLRNNILAMSVIKLLQTKGDEVQPVEIINDRGIHIAKSMWGYLFKYISEGETWREKLEIWLQNPDKWPTPEKLNLKGDHFNGQCYVFAEKQLQSKDSGVT